MPKLSKFFKARNLEKKKLAVALYDTGLTLRQVAEKIGRSHEWVRQAVYELSDTVDK